MSLASILLLLFILGLFAAQVVARRRRALPSSLQPSVRVALSSAIDTVAALNQAITPPLKGAGLHAQRRTTQLGEASADQDTPTRGPRITSGVEARQSPVDLSSVPVPRSNAAQRPIPDGSREVQPGASLPAERGEEPRRSRPARPTSTVRPPPHTAVGVRFQGAAQASARGLRELLDLASRYVQDQNGDRAKAIPYLQKILDSPQRVSIYYMVAACLLGEIYRGQGDFLRARQFYELAIEEGDSPRISEEERSRPRDYYADYRPRAALGLILTMRRTLGAPRRIRELTEETRERFASMKEDLAAQTLVLEGLLARQLGDCDRARDCLEDALGQMEGLKPPFSLLWPEHVKAFLAQTGALIRSKRLPATRAAQEILRAANTGPWCQAMAAATLLHVELDRTLEDGMSATEVLEQLKSPAKDAPGRLLQWLEEAANLEGDPYLQSESSVLHAAWLMAAEAPQQAAYYRKRLLDQVRTLSAPLGLLRSIEASIIFPSDGGEELHELRRLGGERFNQLREVIEQYRLDPDLFEQYAAHLGGNVPARPGRPSAWLTDEIVALRQLVWP